jgi:hypothetical protein
MSSVRVSVDETTKRWYAGHDQYSAFLWCVSYIIIVLIIIIILYYQYSASLTRARVRRQCIRESRFVRPLRCMPCVHIMCVHALHLHKHRQTLKLQQSSYDKTHTVVVTCRWRDQV